MITRTVVDGETTRLELSIEGSVDALWVSLSSLPQSRDRYPHLDEIHPLSVDPVIRGSVWLTGNQSCAAEKNERGPLRLICVRGGDHSWPDGIEPLIVDLGQNLMARANEVEPLVRLIEQQSQSLVDAVLGIDAQLAELRERADLCWERSLPPKPATTEPGRGIRWPWSLRRREPESP